jgi:hypothetical protein
MEEALRVERVRMLEIYAAGTSFGDRLSIGRRI